MPYCDDSSEDDAAPVDDGTPELLVAACEDTAPLDVAGVGVLEVAGSLESDSVELEAPVESGPTEASEDVVEESEPDANDTSGRSALTAAVAETSRIPAPAVTATSASDSELVLGASVDAAVPCRRNHRMPFPTSAAGSFLISRCTSSMCCGDAFAFKVREA